MRKLPPPWEAEGWVPPGTKSLPPAETSTFEFFDGFDDEDTDLGDAPIDPENLEDVWDFANEEDSDPEEIVNLDGVGIDLRGVLRSGR